jgi:hypothetical protein
VADLAVFEQCLAVIGGHDHERVVRDTFEQFADPLVGVSDRRRVQPADGLALAFRETLGGSLSPGRQSCGVTLERGDADRSAVAFGRRVRCMRFEQVRPDERSVPTLSAASVVSNRLACDAYLVVAGPGDRAKRPLEPSVGVLCAPVDRVIEREAIEQQTPTALEEGQSELPDVAVDVVPTAVPVPLAEPGVRVNACTPPARSMQGLAEQLTFGADPLVPTVVER